MSTSDKGNRAARLVKGMISNGIFPPHLLQIEMEPAEVQDIDMQIKGADVAITVAKKSVVQVKCDFRGGGTKLQDAKYPSGNLFLQVRECNPWGRY